MEQRIEQNLGTVAQAIEFSLTVDDHFEMREFLEGWMHGDIEEWPEYTAWLEAK